MEQHWLITSARVEVSRKGSHLHLPSREALVRVIIECSLHRDRCSVIRCDPLSQLMSSYDVMLSFVPEKKLVSRLE